MRCWLRALILIAVAFPTLAEGAVFYPETFTLANGLQFVVVQNRLSSAVAQMVWYRVGSADEDAGKSGMAHYLEHLMFRGTSEVPAGEFSKAVAAMGGQDNAFTTQDYTAYYEAVASERLGAIMQLEADRMQNLRISPEIAMPELDVVLSERNERTDNNPEGIFHERVKAALFPNHPYGNPVIGHRDELGKITSADAMEFYLRHYSPNNAVVVISGNVDMGEVMRLAAGTFGRVPARNAVERKKIFRPEIPLQPRIEMKDSRVEQQQFQLLNVVPSYSTQTGGKAYAFEVLQEVLGAGEVGELYRSLVIKQKIASAVSVGYGPESRGPAIFSVMATPQPGKKIKELEAALDSELKKLAKRGMDKNKVAEAKERLRRAAIFARDSLMAPCYSFGAALTTGQKIVDVETWPEKIGSVTVAQVNDALRELVSNNRRVTAILSPDGDK